MKTHLTLALAAALALARLAALPAAATAQATLLSASFDTDTNGFVYADDAFGTNQPSYGFSGSTTLQTGDFQATATVVQAASLSNAAANGDWSEGSLSAAGLAAISKTGTTQLRVYFNLDDNDDTGNDYIGWYSGDNATSANRPQLVVTYQ